METKAAAARVAPDPEAEAIAATSPSPLIVAPKDWAARAGAAAPAHENIGGGGQISSLHGLRFFAAFCILFGHSCRWLGYFPDHAQITVFGQFFSVYGMTLFFVLSGFIIHYNYNKLFARTRLRWAILEFAGARFARLYPLFLCAVAMGLAVNGVLQWSYSAEFNFYLSVLHDLSLTQSWAYIVFFNDRILLENVFGLGWSISTEMFFYIFYAAFFFVFAGLRRIRHIFYAISLTGILSITLILLCARHRPSLERFATMYMNDHFNAFAHSAIRWFFYYSPYVRILEFILGCLTAQLFLRLSGKPVLPMENRIAWNIQWCALAILVIFGLGACFQWFGSPIEPYLDFLGLNFGPAIPLAVVIFCVSRYDSSLRTLLSSSAMVLLGELSYSIYIVHTWTLRIFERPAQTYSVGLAWEAVYRIAIALAFTLIVAGATYRLIEVPARRSLRNRTARALSRLFGAKEDNALPDGRGHATRSIVGLVSAFALLLAALLVYQFAVTPSFRAYIR